MTNENTPSEITSDDPAKKLPLSLGWSSIIIAFVFSWAYWITPISWYGIRDWVHLVLTAPFIVLAGYVAYQRRNIPLGIIAVVSIFAPAIIITVTIIIYGV